jgi:hypothetical protein
MPNRVAFDVYQGEDRTLTMEARTDLNAPLSLTGATLSWRVGRNPYRLDDSWPIFTKTGTIVASASGQLSVSVSATDTQYMCGDYWHQCWATISGQSYVVADGRFRVRDYIQGGSD